jgi:hypothetical protein
MLKGNSLLRRLLNEAGFGFEALSAPASDALADLRGVLTADYAFATGLPAGGLVRELDEVIKGQAKLHGAIWKQWGDSRNFERFNGGRACEIVVRARPYLEGAGLSLWGFSCTLRVGGKIKHVIFLNTAHEPGAIATTIGHEIGHLIYRAMVKQRVGATEGSVSDMAAMEPVFSGHLGCVEELFSDSVVALSAYGRRGTKQILRQGAAPARSIAQAVQGLQNAFGLIDPRYRIDLTRRGIEPPWRIRYLTAMVHFFKLRCALLEIAGI